MKIIIKKIYSIYSLLLAVLLSILGIQSACHNEAEYGVPSATYKVNGKITADSTGQNLSGIQISMLNDTALSDVDGNYNLLVETYQLTQVYIRFSDIDDTINGKFLAKDTLISFEGATYAGGDDDWYLGETSKTVNVSLNADEGK